MRPLVLLACSVVPALVHAQGQVHVVDPLGGGDFTTLAAAFSAALDGDIVLVRAGDYSASAQGLFLPSERALAVVAEAGASVRVMSLELDGLSAARPVLVQGLDLETLGGLRVSVRNAAGPVWFERCTFEHVVGGTASQGGVALEGAASVVFARSTLGPPVELLMPNGTALSAFASRLHLHTTSVLGLDATAIAVHAQQGSTVELSGSSVRGGDGLPGTPFHCSGFDGGIALVLAGASRATALDAEIAGGAGGPPLAGSSCLPGEDGLDRLTLGGSTFTALAGPAREYELSSPVRENTLAQVTLRGQPGDRVWIQYATLPAPGQTLGPVDGELLTATPRQTVALGTLPASGTLLLQVPVPPLPAASEGAVFYTQALFRGAGGGRFVAGPPAALVVLDDSL